MSLCRLSVSCKANPAVPDETEYKDRLVSNFQQRSESYDDNNSLHPPLCRELVRRAKLKPGETVLDAACGTGYISLQAARLVGPSGDLRCTQRSLHQGRFCCGWSPHGFVWQETERCWKEGRVRG